MYNIDYSILCHYPSLVSKDCITIAILFFNKDTLECQLRCTHNWSRIQSFNDELNIDLIKYEIEGINEEIHEIAKSPKFELKDYTKFFVNSLKFSNILSVKVDNFDEFIEECSKQYLRFDYSKNNRPSTNDQVKFIKKYLNNNEIEFSSKAITGVFNESISFNFIIKNYAFKLFRFEEKKETKMIRFVKDWAYDALKLKDKYKIIFITDIDFREKNQYQTLYNILKEEAYKILSFEETISFIESIK